LPGYHDGSCIRCSHWSSASFWTAWVVCLFSLILNCLYSIKLWLIAQNSATSTTATTATTTTATSKWNYFNNKKSLCKNWFRIKEKDKIKIYFFVWIETFFYWLHANITLFLIIYASYSKSPKVHLPAIFYKFSRK